MKDDYNRDDMDVVIDGNNINEDVIERILGELRWRKKVCLKLNMIKQTI